MKPRSKPVAALLAFVLLLVPALAFASCSHRDMPGMSGEFSSAMAGMVMPPEGSMLSDPSIASCCVDSPAEITSSPFPTNPAPAVLAMAAFTLDLSPARHRLIATPVFGTPRPPGQAVLCVFLI